MRRLLLLSAFFSLIFCSYSVNSQILFDENFDYPAGDSIGAHGWVWNTGTTNTIFVATPGLTFAGYPNSGVGNQCHLRNNGNDAYKGFNADSSGSIYCAFMVNLDSIKTSGDYFFALLPNNSTTNYTARFYVKDTLGGASFGISKGTSASNTVYWTSTPYTLGVSYLVIIKYTFLTGSTTDDEIRVFILNSSIPATEPGSPTLGPATGPATDAPNIGRVAIRQGSATIAPTLEIDGFRVFKTWSNIVGVIPISTVAEKFTLSQNYPNPFNPVTNIRFSIPERGNVSLKVFDMLGKEVSSLVEGVYSIGTYEVNFDAKGFGSGTYIYRMNFSSESGKSFTDTKKLVLVK